MSQLIPIERIQDKIYLIRGHKVMLDRDLAKLYGVPTMRLNEQVKRNIKRFPTDFMFQLIKEDCLQSSFYSVLVQQSTHSHVCQNSIAFYNHNI